MNKPNTRGKPPTIIIDAKAKLKALIENGTYTPNFVGSLKQKQLVAILGVKSRETAEKARRQVLEELEAQSGGTPTNGDK